MKWRSARRASYSVSLHVCVWTSRVSLCFVL